MKIALLAFTFVALASVSRAQETWSIGPVPALSVTDTANIITAENSKTCERFSLAAGCTQAQACTAANAVGGSGCTPANARLVNARIYPATQAGREEFVTYVFIIPGIEDRKRIVSAYQRTVACKNWETMTATERNTLCAATKSAVPATTALGCDLSCK